jgi:chromosomal replication initiator protein
VKSGIWQRCLSRLESEMPPQQFNVWIRPLKADDSDSALRIYAPNQFIHDWIASKYLNTIKKVCSEVAPEIGSAIELTVNNSESKAREHVVSPATEVVKTIPAIEVKTRRREDAPNVIQTTALNGNFVFEQFVEGKSNQLARAASQQVAENPGSAYNPLFLYGGVGLGKTHLMHAIGNHIIKNNPRARVAYLHSERFVQDMVKALQQNAITKFKTYYRSLNVLLIDDIQFFAGKERSQEEFFHTFNQLLEGQKQIVLTCDRYPKEVEGLEERLKSRFGWGLTVAIEPPDYETRVAILMSKAKQLRIDLPDEVGFFVAKKIRSNVRELEGALRRISANSQFRGEPITLEFSKETLKDLLALQDKLVTIENIQKVVAEYYKIRFSELISKKRTRSVARPRQVAMSLAKELTGHSLPEIGSAFGGRDHTTVIHAYRKVDELRRSDSKIDEDMNNLMRILTT